MALKDDNTLITKGDLKKFYNKILPYMGGNYVFNTLGTKDYYSEDEKVIGVWTDGRPVYRKVYSTPSISISNNTNLVPYIDNFSDIENVLEAIAVGESTYKNLIYLDLCYSGGKLLVLDVQSSFGLMNYIILDYTKTTDAVNSAVDTIGCYDITRPDLWPENKEINFGYGLYGQRFVGTYTPIACSASTTIEPTGLVDTVLLSGVEYTQSIGGHVKGYNSNTLFAIPTSNNNNANGVSIYVTQSGDLTLRSVCWKELKSTSVTNKEYDIWVTYKKK